MIPNRFALFLVPLLAIFLAGAGCERRSREITLGLVAPLTGESAFEGLYSRMGFELAMEEGNARGGVLGRPLRMAIVDDKGDPGEGATVFMKLLERDRVAAIIGPNQTKICMAGGPLAQRARVPMVATVATNPKVTAVGDYIFRTCFTDTLQSRVAGRFAYEDLKARKVACLFDLGNDYTLGLAEGFRDAFTALGGRISGFEGHATGTVDFKAQLSKILKSGPDLIYVPDYYNDSALIVRQVRELGYAGPLLGGDGWDSPQILKIAGGALDGCFHTAHCSPDDPDPQVQAFVQRFRARFKAEPDGHAVMDYDAATLVLEAIRRAGTTEGPALREALARMELDTVAGRVRFDAQRNPVKPVTFVEIREGRQVFRKKVQA